MKDQNVEIILGIFIFREFELIIAPILSENRFPYVANTINSNFGFSFME